ncbi:MAG: plasmid pRiA4b ORF-3 family protein [Lewinellaceae bacterium]|nr:plasmid pRiA4b ORF-3 family protein [Lewinellaceae bacterium]
MENILQFKITLKEIRPLIWRRIQVTDDYRFDRFHQVIQIAMAWWNYHLHEFHIKGREIGMPDDDYAYEFPNLEDEATVYLRDLELKKEMNSLICMILATIGSTFSKWRK